MNDKNNRPGGLRSGFTPLGVWAFSIGTSIGWGSFIVTCSAYLQKSGVLGTVFGLLIGMAVIFVITWNLQYMIRSAPNAGGVYAFEKQIGGKHIGFLAMWFVLLTYLAILWANITSVPLFARFFLGDTFRFGFHYTIFGYEVWLGEALLSIGAAILVGLFLCAAGSRATNRVMIVSALTFAAGFFVCAVLAVVRHDASYSYSPLYTEGSGAFAQIVRIAAISPWAFIGFENVSHFSEEYSFPVKKIKKILISSVVVTTALYLAVSALSVSAYPPEYASWLDYIKDMGNLEGIKAVPAFYAADRYLGQTGVTILMISLFAVILTSLIGNLLALSRLIYAAGRDGDAPKALSGLNKRGVPSKAIFAVVAISVVIPFLGRTAIGWIVDVTTLGATLIYGIISHAVFKHAKQSARRAERITGVAGVALMICFIVLLMIPGLLPFHAMETESYVLFIVWSVLGLIYFRRLLHKDTERLLAQRLVVWVLLLVLVLFASMMWVSRETENAANRSVEQIVEYHENHPTDDSNPNVREERVAFLQDQAKQISGTNTIYTAVSLGMFLIVISIMLNNYRDTQKLDARLTAAEKEADAAKKIAELSGTITSLLDNMPGMNFTKDAASGVYLACNQAFADYAHKETPEGVVGLTDAQIFDSKTAAHFVEDDKMALSMDVPYIFYEDVPDAAGNKRQLQTTKLKYTDASGRLCVLGVCRDVTDAVRIRREDVKSKEEYEKARVTGIMYHHIARSFTRSYEMLYYVDLETNEFIEYRTDEESGMLKEVMRGERFFESLKASAPNLVHPDDLEAVTKALDRDTLLSALERNKSFVMTYRVITGDEPKYVTLKASRMEDDLDALVIGVTDVDEQMKRQKAEEQVKEELVAYTRMNALSGDYICVYVVDPVSGDYREYTSSEGYDTLALSKNGERFFETTRELAKKFVYPDDLDRFLSLFTADGVMSEVERRGVYAMSYRLVLRGKPTHVQIKAAMVEEKDGRRLIVGINDVDSQVRQEEEYARRLAQAQSKANIDALTGVKNRHAYLDAEEQLDRRIAEHSCPPFAIVIMDVNDLKKVNDTNGHQAGDRYLRDACNAICDVFKNSPVFRVGGDEFAVIAQGEDFENIDGLVEKVGEYNAGAIAEGTVVIACGMARFGDGDDCVAPVFERADRIMYENKSALKGN